MTLPRSEVRANLLEAFRQGLPQDGSDHGNQEIKPAGVKGLRQKLWRRQRQKATCAGTEPVSGGGVGGRGVARARPDAQLSWCSRSRNCHYALYARRHEDAPLARTSKPLSCALVLPKGVSSRDGCRCQTRSAKALPHEELIKCLEAKRRRSTGGILTAVWT